MFSAFFSTIDGYKGYQLLHYFGLWEEFYEAFVSRYVIDIGMALPAFLKEQGIILTEKGFKLEANSRFNETDAEKRFELYMRFREEQT